jgi:hypothetical protein
MGRPSKYQPEHKQIARMMGRLGATDAQLAEAFEVAESTIHLWKKEHPEFSEALKDGKKEADSAVERSLFERATGYSHPEDKIFQYEGAPVVVPTTKIYPPDVTACIFWLKNRKPKDWRDKQEIEHSGEMEIKVTIGGDA